MYSFLRFSWHGSLSVRQNRLTEKTVLKCILSLGGVILCSYQHMSTTEDIADTSLQRCQRLALKHSISVTCYLIINVYYWQSTCVIIEFLSRAEAELPTAARRLCYVLRCVLCFHLCCANFVQNFRDSPSWSELPAWHAGFLAKSLGV